MSQVTISNQAIGQLGGELITQIGQDSVEGRLIDAYYAPIRDAVLEEHEWAFAIKKFRLIPTDEDPAYGYTFSYIIPGEVIRVLLVRGDARSDMWGGNTLRWERIGDRIESDNEEIFLRAIVRITNDVLFSSMFVQAFVMRLASEMAVPLTNSRALKESFFQLYLNRLAEAASADGMQGRNKVIRSTNLTGVRRAGFGTTGTFGGFIGPFV